MNALYGVYGASGCGRGIMPLAREQLGLSKKLYFIDDYPEATIVNSQPVLTFDDFLALPAQKRYVAIAIANSKIREKLADKLAQHGCLPWSISARQLVMMDDVSVGEGALLSPFVTLTSNIRIGRYFHGNINSYIEHDCVIGDFVTFAPRASCNGNVVIEDHAYIGSGAVIKQGTSASPLVIGQGAVIGMGAVVTKSVPAGATMVGNPARIMVKN